MIHWGRGKASNVVVHKEQNDAWLIDFGGEFTKGWVSQDAVGTWDGTSTPSRAF